MAILWDQPTPWIDPNGDPYSGAKAFFFDANTTTPLIVYTDAGFNVPHDHPVVANADGSFPPVFLEPQIDYRVRIETAEGVTLSDIDGISTPPVVIPTPPSGDTPIELLFQTGDIKIAWRTSSPNGWVRCNGRTIGSGASAATERANSDCQDLFIFLWNNDATLAVSGGRGATANGDWAAAKTIALPDARGRSLTGRDGMGGAAANRITTAVLGTDSDVLGSAGGSQTHVLTTGELASHSHTATTASAGAHTHTVAIFDSTNVGGGGASRMSAGGSTPTSEAGAHTHTVTVNDTGSNQAHNNLSPVLMMTVFIKL